MGEAQAEAVVPDVGVVAAPVRHTAVPGKVAPTAATGHAVRAGRRPQGISLR